ncbi:MAG: Na+/H+ antiporter subunit E [Actinomycetota bacterium]|nr:Na+/H+ antiporter subunit E [Actinomycetota bacterium]
MRKLVGAISGAALAASFYLLLIDTTSLPELYAMAGVVLLAGLAFLASLQQGFTEASIRPRWLLRGYRPLLGVPRQIALVAVEAAAQLIHPRRTRGRLRAIPFAGGEGPHDIGRRALSEALGSLAPNTIVIGVDPERHLLLVHQLHRDGDADELDVLGLG